MSALKSIPRQELKPGMHVVSHGQGSFDDPLVRVDKCLPSRESIDAHVPAQARNILVDPERSELIEPTPLDQEAATVRRLYAEALGHVRRFVTEVRQGRDIDVREAAPVVDGFIESVFRNESAAATLFKLRGFDEYTYTHSINVSILAILLGKHLGMDRETLRELGVAGLFHDMGKARIPEAILNKPGKLTPEEFAVMKAHPAEGFRLLRGQPGLNPEVLRAVVEHHERQDGSGYPRGLKGPDIGRFARIISVADVYDALTSRRVYKEPMAPSKALGLMYQWRDRDFTPQTIEHFIRCLGVYPPGSLVRLSGGEHAIVVGSNHEHGTRPVVRLVLDAHLRPRPVEDLDLDALHGTPRAQEIVAVLNPAEHGVQPDTFFPS